jgi:polyhydroxybutyrate depolymerase
MNVTLAMRAGYGVSNTPGSLRVMAKGRLPTFVLVTAVLVAAVLMGSCTSSSSRASETSTTGAGATSTTITTACTRPHAAGQFAEKFDFEGVARTYQLYVPPAYRGARAVPVVFNFHGYGSNAVQQMVYGNFKPLADRNDFLIVAPDGQGARRHFNLTNEKGLQNDIKMVLALLDHIEETFCVDRARVFSTGMSDGGAVTSVLACLAPDRFAAFGAVAVEVHFTGCGGDRPVSIVAFHGTADRIVPFDGGRSAVAGAIVGAAPTTMAAWAAHDQCDAAFVERRLGSQVRRRTWSGCDGSSSVVFYIIDGGGHSWPGGIPIARFGMTTPQIDASETIWAFFAAHPLQG